MDAAGGQEVRLPVLQPLELWEESGRRKAFGDNLFTLQDRRRRPMVMAPTHEEVISLIARTHVQSYRDLPRMPYQIQTKFRDEPRSRGGLIRVREFDMKDAYSMDADAEGLDASYDAMAQAYRNIYRPLRPPRRYGGRRQRSHRRAGLPRVHPSRLHRRRHDSPLPRLRLCRQPGKSPGSEAAPAHRGASPLKEVSTPGIKTIAELCDFLDVPESRTLKAVFYRADGETVFVTIRGDLEVNEVKLTTYLKAKDLRLATEEETRAAGLVAGSASAVGLTGIRCIMDDSVKLGSNFLVGANKPDTHLQNANHPRDFQLEEVTDIALAEEGQPCVRCGKPLEALRGIEVGHIFKLGTFYSETLGVYYLDRDGARRPVIMGCYGIGVGRLLAAAIEQNHDEQGIIFPVPIAPYQVHVVGLNLTDEAVSREADALYDSLWDAGVECLYDDRPDESAGVKFNDADLLGLPLRLVISRRALRNGAVEIRRRAGDDKPVLTPFEDVESTIQEMLTSSPVLGED